MLVHLHVKNLALIEETEVEFGPGLNILTGETGAGKSILLGSIQLILGGKTSRSMIRKIACLEEIAYLNGWITKEDVLKVYEILKKNQYGQYLKDVLDGKYLDALH